MSQGFGAQKMEAAVEALTSNGNQREPSMEEILASIRRIIEDNDAPAARSADAGETGEAPTNEAPNDVLGEAEAHGSEVFSQNALPQSQPSRQSARPLHAGPSDHEEAASAEQSHQVESFRTELRDAAKREDEKSSAESATSFSATAETASSDTEPGVDRGLMQRLAEAQTARSTITMAEGGADRHSHEPTRMPQAITGEAGDDAKQSILSEYTGRKVAAAFGELNEAFEANRRRNFDQMAEEMLRPMLQDWLDNNLPNIVERLVREEIERIARGG